MTTIFCGALALLACVPWNRASSGDAGGINADAVGADTSISVADVIGDVRAVADVSRDVPIAVRDVPIAVSDVPVAVSDVPVAVRDVPPDVSELTCSRSGAVDILLMIDNSNSMRDNQASLARNLNAMVPILIQSGGLRSLHLGVVSSDLGTPGSQVPSCANSDVGDDGLINPIRNGLAIRSHQPWTTLPAGVRPSHCQNRPDQFPTYLSFDPFRDDPGAFSADAVCTALLSTGGCGLDQQIESVYRALVVRDPRERAGNMDINQGFLRPDSVLGVLFFTDEEDGSTRDCRYAEPGDPDRTCAPGGPGDALGVFDSTNGQWSAPDLNLRFYMYRPGTAQDPTWPLNRYIDPARPNRGFFSRMVGRRNLFVLGAITGVPNEIPRTAGRVDWERLLGRQFDGSDGYLANSPEGPISMRQANMDPQCSTRVVPGCRREGSGSQPMACDTSTQYYAWPSRRVAELVRRAEAVNANGVISSICLNDYSPAIRAFAELIGRRLCPF